jgi:TIR domain
VKSREVFVSYSHPDRDCAFDIVAWLEARNIGVWIAPRDLSPTADWAAEVIDAISAARIMVLVFSANTNESVQVRREVERAVHKGLIVLPFRIEDVLPIKSLEYFLSSQHWLDAFPSPREPYYERLCQYLERALATPAARADRPPAGSGPSSLGDGSTTASFLDDNAVLDAAPHPHVANPEQLGRLEIELARYIGPVAKHLVRRATANAVDLPQLILRLSAEVDSDKDRQKFVSSCQALLGSPR